MNRKEVIDFLGSDWGGMLDFIHSSLKSGVTMLQELNNAIQNRSGKQLRPMVSLLVAGLCGEPNDASLRYAAASELLHNATLMHDDVVDKSPERRGAPTLGAMIGPTAAVLVGDFWLAKAVELIVLRDPDQKVINQFSKTLRELAEGELLQLQRSEDCATTEEDYMKVIHCKTTSLFETACLSGALSVGACGEKLEAVRRYSHALGNAFQIKDDILDYAGDESLGKPVGADIMERKITLPLLGAFANVPERESEMRSKVKDILSKPELGEEIRAFVASHKGVEWAAKRLEKQIDLAVKALDIFDDCPQKTYLVQIARYNAFRTV